MAPYGPYGKAALRALSLTPYGPGFFAEEAYVSFMARYGPYKPYEQEASKRPPKCYQEASKRPARGQQEASKRPARARGQQEAKRPGRGPKLGGTPRNTETIEKQPFS